MTHNDLKNFTWNELRQFTHNQLTLDSVTLFRSALRDEITLTKSTQLKLEALVDKAADIYNYSLTSNTKQVPSSISNVDKFLSILTNLVTISFAIFSQSSSSKSIDTPNIEIYNEYNINISVEDCCSIKEEIDNILDEINALSEDTNEVQQDTDNHGNQ